MEILDGVPAGALPEDMDKAVRDELEKRWKEAKVNAKDGLRKRVSKAWNKAG